ncbi:hypothetical protein PG985_011395 [Apiospora marii]|uniref:C2H2-type domain-containing protein n=1 Tax=Apiospora marii TaxID=335849 RepID=A0ABR1STW3_9PEZI
MPLSISDRCHAIQQSLIDYGGQTSDARERVADLTARFQLWAGNLGAFHHPSQKLSLDARVAQSPEIRDEILRHLQEIEQASFESIPSEEVHHDQIGRASPVDEFAVLIEVMSQSLAFLFRLAVLVKAPGSDNRWNRALQRTDPFPDDFDYNHAIAKYSYLETDNDGKKLARRIAQASIRRRQFIQYSRDHTANLSSDARPSVTNDRATERVSSKATTLPPAMNLSTLSVQEVDDDLESLMTASTTFDTDKKLRLPLLSSLSPEGEAFQCPICFTIRQFNREKAWKAHAYQDLKAYICTIGGKDCASSMFGDRKSWFDHEITQHRSQFVCTLCNKPCQDKDATMSHIKHSHGLNLPGQLSMLADSGRVVPNHFKTTDCPFCDWARERCRRRNKREDDQPPQVETVSRAELKRHIAMHQEQLALFVAPLPDDANESSSSASHSDERRFADSGVRRELEGVFGEVENDMRSPGPSTLDQITTTPGEPQMSSSSHLHGNLFSPNGTSNTRAESISSSTVYDPSDFSEPDDPFFGANFNDFDRSAPTFFDEELVHHNSIESPGLPSDSTRPETAHLRADSPPDRGRLGVGPARPGAGQGGLIREARKVSIQDRS